MGVVLALSVSLSGAIASVAGGAASDWVVGRWGMPSRVVLLLGCYALAAAGAVAVFFAGTGHQTAMALAIWAFGSIGGYVIGRIVMQEWVPNEMRATTVAVSVDGQRPDRHRPGPRTARTSRPRRLDLDFGCRSWRADCVAARISCASGRHCR